MLDANCECSSGVALPFTNRYELINQDMAHYTEWDKIVAINSIDLLINQFPEKVTTDADVQLWDDLRTIKQLLA